MPGCQIAEQNIQVDHTYLFKAIPQNCAIDEVTVEMKQYTAGRLLNKLAWLRKVCWKKQVVCSPVYFVPWLDWIKNRLLSM
jgi:REP element-mobilizing transposase RayT